MIEKLVATVKDATNWTTETYSASNNTNLFLLLWGVATCEHSAAYGAMD